MRKRYLSFLLALVMIVVALPGLSIPAFAVSLTQDVWNGGDGVRATLGNRGGAFSVLGFYQWYAPDDTPLREQNIEDAFSLPSEGYYAKINPSLFLFGILDEDATYEEQLAQYRKYVEGAGQVTYPANWAIDVVDLQTGNREKIDRLAMFHASSIYGIGASTDPDRAMMRYWQAGIMGTTSVVEAHLESYFAAALSSSVKPDAEGKIYAKDLSGAWDSGKLLTEDWSSDAAVLVTGNKLADGNQTMFVAPHTGMGGIVAYSYTVPSHLHGNAALTLESLVFETGSSVKLAVLLNGKEVVYPAEAERTDPTTWKTVTAADVPELKAELAAIGGVAVREGDVISFSLSRVENDPCVVDMRPSVEIDKMCLVTFFDQMGNEVYSELVEPGSPAPQPPIASQNGFYINFGFEPVATLPDRVTEDLIVQYAGDFEIQPIMFAGARMTISQDFSITLHLAGDPHAIGMGILGEHGETIPAEKMENGAYKLCFTDIAVKDLGKVIELPLYQEFIGGRKIAEKEVCSITPLEILQIYEEEVPEAKEIARAALDYYAAANAYFNGGELEAEIAARLALQDAAIAALSKDVPLTGDGDYTIRAATLVLKEQVSIKIAVALTDGGALTEEDLAIAVRVNGVEYTGFSMQAGSNGVMVLTLPGVAPVAFGDALEIAVTKNGEAVSQTLSYSVNSYIARTFEGGEGETDDLLRALYAFGVAVK